MGEHRVLDEHRADGERAAGHHQATDHGDQDVVDVPDEEVDRHDDARDELGAEGGVVQLLVLRVERGLHLTTPAEHLHQVVAGVGLLDLAVQLAGRLPGLGEQLLRALADQHGDRERDRDGHQ